VKRYKWLAVGSCRSIASGDDLRGRDKRGGEFSCQGVGVVMQLRAPMSGAIQFGLLPAWFIAGAPLRSEKLKELLNTQGQQCERNAGRTRRIGCLRNGHEAEGG
jgi:hypothetical protein